MAKAKIGASCNQSPAVGEIAGAHLTEAAGKGVKCDTNGNMVLTEAATGPKTPTTKKTKQNKKKQQQKKKQKK